MDEIHSQKALVLHRKQRIEAIIAKRLGNLRYLKKFHEGGHFWMNIFSMTKADLRSFSHNAKTQQKNIGYFYLGISLSKIYDALIKDSDGRKRNLDSQSAIKFVRALNQLLEEFDFYFASTAMQYVKYGLAKTAPSAYPTFNTFYDYSISGTNIVDADTVFKPALNKFQSDIVYEFLLTPSIPFACEYPEVLSSLCDILMLIYECLSDPVFYRYVEMFEEIEKIDTKLKNNVICYVSKELSDHATNSLQNEFEGLRSQGPV